MKSLSYDHLLLTNPKFYVKVIANSLTEALYISSIKLILFRLEHVHHHPKENI